MFHLFKVIIPEDKQKHSNFDETKEVMMGQENLWEKPLENSLQPTWCCEFPRVSTLGAYFRLDTRRVPLIKFQVLFFTVLLLLFFSNVSWCLTPYDNNNNPDDIVYSLYHGPWLYWSSVSNKPCILFENFNIPNTPSTFEPCQVSLSFPGQFIATEP